MSEKRILCIEVSAECRYFAKINTPFVANLFECKQGLYCIKDIAWKPIEKDTCKNCKCAKYQGITREQAIEKMAAALQSVAVDRGGVNSDEDSTLDPRMLAEAALDALLEGKHEN